MPLKSFTPEQLASAKSAVSAKLANIAQGHAYIKTAEEEAAGPIKALMDLVGSSGPFDFDGHDVEFRHVRGSSPDRYAVKPYAPKTAL